MRVTFNITDKSQLTDQAALDYFNELELLANNSKSGVTKVGPENGCIMFKSIINETVDISKRLLFISHPNVSISLFPIFMFAKKGFEETEIFSGLPNRTTEVEIQDLTVEVIKSFNEWDTDIPTVIMENDNYVMIQLDVLGAYLTDEYLNILSSFASSSDIDILTTSEFKLCGMKEFELYKNIYFTI